MKLRLVGFEAAQRTAGTFTFIDGETGNTYPMLPTEFNRLCAAKSMSSCIDGVWSAEKKGRAYGIKLIRLV